MIDDEDYNKVIGYSWTLTGLFNKQIHSSIGMLSTFLKGDTPIDPLYGKLHWDHKDRNFLNNQKNNLRSSTRGQNAINQNKKLEFSSKYKGVSWSKRDKVWRAYIKIDGQTHSLGTFKNEIEAAKVYDRESFKAFGEFAVLNFPGVVEIL